MSPKALRPREYALLMLAAQNHPADAADLVARARRLWLEMGRLQRGQANRLFLELDRKEYLEKRKAAQR